MISMIRNKYLTLIGAGLLFTAVSCTDGYEPEPVELVSIDFVFSKTDSLGTNAVKFMNNIYATLQNGHNRVGSDYLDAASDDAISINVSDPDVYKLAMGRYTASTRVESDMRWKEYYSGIRKANILINHIDVVPFMLTYKNAKGETKPLNITMKAEARFLRAYFYFELVKRYGGVPLMGDDVHILGDDMEIPRNTFEQCVQYICDELDDIKDDLRTNPMPDFEQYAHTPTREACLALKSRVLLYAASPLFNERPIEIGNELIGYASYDRERWNDAAKAAKTFIDEYGPNGNGAYGLTQSTSDGDNRDFRDVFLGFYNKTNNPEVIFYRPGGEDKSIESNNGPLGFSGDNLGKGRTLPTQNLVDAFPMKDGMFAGQGSKYTLNQRIGAFTVSRPDLVTTKYLYYILSRNPQLLRYDNGADQTNLRKADILNILIVIPTVKEQKKITEILDRFDILCNDLSTGLPAEIEARQKQYEYYRDKLLSFKELPK